METTEFYNKNPQYRKVQALVGESSFSIVLPKLYALELGISKGEFLKITCANKKIIVEKITE
jgi:hypothetical protein